MLVVNIKRLIVPSWNLSFSWKLSKLYFHLPFCVQKVNLPPYYFVKSDKNKLIFLTISNLNSSVIFNQVSRLKFNYLFFFKLRIRGLGYRLRSISEYCHYLFFNYTNYYYFFNPKNILVKTYKKRMILISFDWSKLRSLICHILLLQTLGPYTLQGIRWVKQFVILKRSGKKV